MSISIVQQQNQVQGTNPTSTLSGVTAGNTLIVQFVSASLTVPTFSDSAGNNWQVAESYAFNDGATNRTVGIAYATNVFAGSTTVTCTSGATATFGIQEWTTGLAQTYLLLDQVNTGNGSGTSMTTVNVTTLKNAEVLIGAFFNAQSTSHSHWSAGSGFTGTNGFANQLLGEYQVVSSTGTYAATASSSDSATAYGGVIATFYISPLPVFNTTVGRFNSAGTLVGGLLAPIWTAANVTPVTANTSTLADQNLMSILIPANTLNSVGRNLHIHCSGVYSLPISSGGTFMTVKIQLGSLTLVDIVTSAADIGGGVTNNKWILDGDITTKTTGASASFEASGQILIDLGALNSAADTIFPDGNQSSVSPVDLTQNQTLQITIAFSNASTSCAATQRQMIVNTIN
jgi:hypothetical protein